MYKPKLASDMPPRLKERYFNAISRVVCMRHEELPRDLADEAQSLMADGLYAAAQDAVQSFPAWDSTYLGHLIMGNCYYRLERLDEADAEWAIADDIRELVNDQRACAVRTNRAMALIMRTEYDKAVQLCDEAIAFFAEWVGPWVNKLSALNKAASQSPASFAARQAEFATSVFADMDRLWPSWRSDEEFAKSLVNDPHLAGVRQYIPARA